MEKFEFKSQICRWPDHKAITIIADNETASCRIHIYDEEPDMAVISDLYVAQGERKKGIATKKQQCPEFPYFGANYPDARCINGYLYDLDDCDDNGNLYENWENIPCPFCNKKEFFERFDCENDESMGKEVYESIVEWVRKNYPDYIIED